LVRINASARSRHQIGGSQMVGNIFIVLAAWTSMIRSRIARIVALGPPP
jgi:hypothetical protein